MKKIAYCLLVVMLTGFVSCKKFLDTTPRDFVSPVTYYETEEHLTFALAGVYDILGTGYLYRTWYISRMGMEADEGCYNPATVTSGPQVYNFSAGDPTIEGFWQTLYMGIYRANALLANVDKNEAIDVAVRNRVRGEALFLRAYYYFLLVQNFGGVPLILEPTMSASGNEVPRTPAVQVYNQIIADMETAEELVLPIQELGYGGQVNKSAVRGILARVCLYMAGNPVKDVSKYERVKYWASKVMDDTEANHKLNPDYADVFIKYARDEYDIGESLFEVEFWGNNSGAELETGQVGAWIGITVSAAAAEANPALGVAAGYVNSTKKLYDLYDEGDVRRDWAISNFTYASNGTKAPITSTTAASYYNRKAAKYRREYELVSPKTNNATPINWPILRFSDVLLMYAEAENEINNGPTQSAIDAVNLVRQRAWSSGIKTITVTSGGNDYTAAPTVSFVGGGGEGAQAIASISNGQVQSVTLGFDAVTGLKAGKGYSSEPTVVFSGGGGSGATATASIHRITDADISPSLDKNDFLELIREERSRELCFEALRKPDLIRWGIFEFVMTNMKNQMATDIPGSHLSLAFRNVTSRHVIFPIPSKDMTLNRALEQNPGW